MVPWVLPGLPRLLLSSGDARGALITSAPSTIRQPATPVHGTRHPTAQRISHWRKKKLSHALGDNALRETGLGAPTISTYFKQKVTSLERKLADVTAQIVAGDDDPAARNSNRELIAQFNHREP